MTNQLKNVFIILSITIKILHSNAQESCNSPLGLDILSSSLPNSSLESSPTSTSGRLNDPKHAWCFDDTQLDKSLVYFGVDLGDLRLVTGFVTQGPPSSIVQSYTHNIQVSVKYGVEENRWNKLRDNSINELRSYANSNDPDKVENHVFHVAVLARYLRFDIDKHDTIISEKGCLRFEILGCDSEYVPKTTLQLTGTDDGNVWASWDSPSVYTGNAWTPLHPDTQFLLSYKEVKINSSFENRAAISTPYFGVEYTFRMECLIPGMRFNCGKTSIYLYPSCPLNWIRYEHLCYYSDGSSETWSETQKKCSNYLTEPDKHEKSSSIKDGVSVWLADSKCIKNDGKCCSIFNLQNLTTNECRSEEKKQQVCLVRKQIRFSKITRMQIRATSINTINITWEDELPGWHTIRRIGSVSKGRRPEPDKFEIKIDEEKDWQSSAEALSWSKLELNSMYSVLVVPEPKAGHTWSNSYTNEFHLISSGAVISVPVESLIRWNGSILVQWDPVKARKTNESTPAVGYTLQYSKTIEKIVRNSSMQTDTHFLVQLPIFGDEYEFVLFCHFDATTIIECGRGKLDWSAVNYKYRRNENSWVIYTYDSDPKSWHDAEKTCTDEGGHLASIADTEEYQLLTRMSDEKKGFWIGGTNCGGKPLKTWVDGLKWTFAAPMKKFRGENCCLRVSYDKNKISTYWEGRICAERISYICKFKVEAFTEPVNDLKTIRTDPTTVTIGWTKPTDQWRPSHYAVEKCTDSCSLVTRVSAISNALITELKPTTSYTFRISTELDPFGSRNSATIDTTTGERKVVLKLSKEGIATVVWTSRPKDEECRVTYRVVGKSNESTTVEGSAAGIVIVGLRFNRTYEFTIEAKNGDVKSDTIRVATIPQCDERQIREGSCYYIGSDKLSRSESKTTCEKTGRILPDARELESQLTFSTIGAKEKVEFWIETGLENECYKVVPQTQDPIKANCDEKLTVVCEKQVEPILLSVLNLKASQMDVATANVTWDPPNSWRVDEYVVALDEIDKKIVELSATHCVLSDLKFNTQYKVSVTPIASVPSSQIRGEPREIKFTLTETSSIPTTTVGKKIRSLTTVNPVLPAKETNEISTVIANHTIPDNLKTFHIISCSVLVALVSLSLLIFLISGIYSYRDVISQIGFEISILVVHTFILMWAVDSSSVDCKSMSICIHFFYTSAYSFLLMETIAIAKAITKIIPITLFQTWWHLFLFGWLLPLITIGISAAVISDDYPTTYPCWLRTANDNLLYASAIPIGLLGGICFLLILACICFRPSTSYEVDEQSFTREKVVQMSRWVILLLLVFITASWICGVTGMENSDENYLLIFIVVNILTGVCILVLRCFGDIEVRQRLRAFCTEDKVHPEDEDGDEELDDDYNDQKANLKFPQKGQLSIIDNLSPPTTDKTALTGPFAWDRYVFRP